MRKRLTRLVICAVDLAAMISLSLIILWASALAGATIGSRSSIGEFAGMITGMVAIPSILMLILRALTGRE